MLDQDKIATALTESTGTEHGTDSVGPTLSDPVGPGLVDSPLVPSIKERAAGLEAHVGKLSSERASLDKWNSNSDGRNQGLVHIVDYAKARPAAKVKGTSLANTNLEDHIGRGALTGESIRKKLGSEGSKAIKDKDFAKFAKANLMPLRKDTGTDTPGTILTRTKEGDSEETVRDLADIEAAIEEAKRAKSEAIQRVPKEERGAWSRGEGAVMQTRIKELEALALERSLYTVPREESKKGRVQTVARAMGEEDDAYAGDEINKVTAALDTMVGADTTTSEHREKDGSSEYTSEGWVKTAPPVAGSEGVEEARATWETGTTTVPDVSAQSTYTSGGGGQKIKAHTWGPNKTSKKYSTVMGA